MMLSVIVDLTPEAIGAWDIDNHLNMIPPILWTIGRAILMNMWFLPDWNCLTLAILSLFPARMGH
jgi:hypothetical protein